MPSLQPSLRAGAIALAVILGMLALTGCGSVGWSKPPPAQRKNDPPNAFPGDMSGQPFGGTS
jgi:predicted small lipoprotein YifL